MIRQYLKFFINGGAIGLISLVLQMSIFKAIGTGSELAYAIATGLTYLPLILLNFIIQRHWIFGREGHFPRFVAANLSVMLIVSLISPACRALVTQIAGVKWGDSTGFGLAAVLMSVPSFLIKRHFVFNR
jgi:hypothetical protein